MEFKNYDALRRFIDQRTARDLAPMLAAAAKPLDKGSFAALQTARLDEAKAALADAERARKDAIAWHDAQVDRAKQRLAAMKQAGEAHAEAAGASAAGRTLKKTVDAKLRKAAKG